MIHYGTEFETALVNRSDDVGRAFVYSRPRNTPTPPSQEGRIYRSDALSSKGARTIQGAAVKALQRDTPLRAMWTFSVADEHLPAFLPSDGYDGAQKPSKTLSGEFRRFWNLMRQWADERGLEPPQYVYCAESKSDGERDYHPHLHVLTSLVVRKADWEQLRDYVNAAWSLGNVHLEVIRNPWQSAKYLLKAVSYSVKGAASGQGRVWGRRWGLSSAIRPVETREVVSFDPGDAWALEDAASVLRDAGRERVATPWGAVTVRGFYPLPGTDPSAAWIASRYAIGVVDGSLRDLRDTS